MEKKILPHFLALALLLPTVGGCSLASYSSQEAFSGALVGTGIGSGIGWLIGNEIGDKTENVAVNAAIGAGAGLLAGALINEQNISIARKREVVVREARLISENQRELDTLRTNLYDSTSWGGNEVCPWDERYQVNTEQLPFQGTTHYKSPFPEK